MEIKTELDYVSGKTLLPPDTFGISPSGINNFITKPHEWYREHVLNQGGFTGNTSSVLGTIVHYCAEMYSKNKEISDHNKREIYNYIYKECVLIKDEKMHKQLMEITDWEEGIEEYLRENCNNPEIDGRVILDQWKPMVTSLINYLIRVGVPSNSEDMIKAEVIPGYFASGSADAYCDKTMTLIDFKTTSDKTPKNYIPMNYKYQLLTYAWIYRQMGVPVDKIKIVWVTRNEVGRVSEKTGKPMKDYPSQVGEAIQEITTSDMNFIEGILKLMSESVKKTEEDPSLTHLIWKDYRLKEGYVNPLDNVPDWAKD